MEFEDSKRPLRAGNVASINILANILKNNLSDELKKFSVENEKFQAFDTEILIESNSNNEMPLAGHSTANDEDDDDSDDNHYETSMDKLFATFTQVKDSYDSSRSQSSENHSETEPEEDEEDALEDDDLKDESPEKRMDEEQTTEEEPE